MLNKILIANRGEIACRIIRTAQRMGISTVAVYSDADRKALHTAMADEAFYIGGSPPSESYLLAENIIKAAEETDAEAIHPGYGFLSENAAFCNLCHQQGLVFIGPPASAITAMGSKSEAKRIMEEAGVPLVPGYHGENQNENYLQEAASEIGFPVLLKAVSGGGGKGMRQVWSQEEFGEALAAAKRESQSSFGDDRMLVEKYLISPRHIEIQVFCDQHGNAVYLAERDCSIQRRYQKIIEEAPAPEITEEQRKEMGEAAIRAAQSIGYQGAGTVEFLYDADGSFYFMEMNTRLQVEHPVTEMITGQDLVEWQLRVANGEELPLSQEQIEVSGHALEARIYAEDPTNDFLPASGTLSFLKTPVENDHVRIDSGVRQGDEVSVYYDPMIAKLVVWDENRARALARLAKALTEYKVSGMATNIDFLYNVASSEYFREGRYDTNFIETNFDQLFKKETENISQGLILATLYLALVQIKEQTPCENDPWSPWNINRCWRLNEAHEQTFELLAEEQSYSLTIKYLPHGDELNCIITSDDFSAVVQGELVGTTLSATIDGHRRRVTVDRQGTVLKIFSQARVLRITLVEPDLGDELFSDNQAALTAPMNGTVVALVAQPHSKVEKGQPLLIMEAMKMEHTIYAPEDGLVDDFFYQPGDLVDGGAELMSFKPTAVREREN